MINKLKTHTMTFYAINIYIFLIVLIPKDISTIGNIIPIRLVLTYLLFGVIVLDFIRKKIVLNDNNNRILLSMFIIFLIATIPSIVISVNRITSLYTVFKFLSYGLLLFSISKIKFEKEEYKYFIKSFIVTIIITVILAIIFYIFDINLFKTGIAVYPLAKGRVNTTFFNTIYLGIFINTIYVLLIYLYNLVKDSSKKIYKMIIIILLLLTPTVLFFTYTRSALLIFLGQMGLLVLLLPKLVFNKKTITVLFVSLLFVLIVPANFNFMKITIRDGINVALGGGIFKNNNTTSVQNDPSLRHRQEFNKMGLRIYNDNKYTGVGFGVYIDYMRSDEFSEKYPDYKLSKTHPHSGEILLRAETGMFSAIIFNVFYILLLLKNIINYILAKKDNNIELKNISGLGLVLTVGFIIVNIISENYIYDIQIFSIFILIYSLILSYMISIYKNKNRKKILIMLK